MPVYSFYTKGPRGEGKPYYSWCEASSPKKAFIVAVNRWEEEYWSCGKMIFTIINDKSLRVWKETFTAGRKPKHWRIPNE